MALTGQPFHFPASVLDGSRRCRQGSTFLYLSLGDQEREMAEPFAAVTEVLRRLAPPAFRWRSDITRGATHVENDELSTPAGLQAYYHADRGAAGSEHRQ